MVWIGYNKLTETKLDSPRLAVVISGVGKEKSLKSGEKEVLVRGGAGMKTGAPLGERWLEERLVSGGSLVSSWGQRGLNIYYARPDRGGVAYSGGGGGKKGS